MSNAADIQIRKLQDAIVIAAETQQLQARKAILNAFKSGLDASVFPSTNPLVTGKEI
jgi:hypothetical protein